MGWLGWTPDVALQTDVNVLILALDGKTDMLEMIYGSGKKERGRKGKKGVTPDRFKAFRDRVNGRARK